MSIFNIVRLVLNTTSLLWRYNSSNLLSLLFISNQCIKKLTSSTVHCHNLADSLTLSFKTMWLCKKCVSQSLSCCVRSESFKCSECAVHTLQKCDLVVSEAEWAKVQCECTHLHIKLCEAIICVSWLQQ